MTTVYLIRHGETEANREFRFQGCIDRPLTEDGLAQADRLAEALKDIPFDCAYTSPMTRARRTAELVCKYHDIPIIPDPALLEICGGAFEGCQVAELQEKFPQQAYNWTHAFHKFVGPGMEDGIPEKYAMVERALRRIARNHPGQTVLLSAHGAIQRIFNCIIQGWLPEKMNDIPWGFNCSYSAAELEEDGTVRPLAVSEASHLEGFRVWLFDAPEK